MRESWEGHVEVGQVKGDWAAERVETANREGLGHQSKLEELEKVLEIIEIGVVKFDCLEVSHMLEVFCETLFKLQMLHDIR